MSSRGTKFGRKLCLAGFYHCWDYCLPRSLPVPLVGLVGWWGSSDLGVLVMAFFTLSVVFCHPRTRATWWDSGTLASPGLSSLLRSLGKTISPAGERGVRCCSFLLHDSTTLWLADVLHFQAWSFSPSCAWGNTAFYQEASELWRQICLYNRFYQGSRRMLATAA